MALAVRATLSGEKAFARALRKFPKGQWKQRALEKGAFLVQELAATEKIRRGSRTAPPIPGILTDRHGGHGLVGSIATDFSRSQEYTEVGTHLVYGATHELGRRGFPKRPFLKPALDDVGPKMPAIFVAELEREFRR